MSIFARCQIFRLIPRTIVLPEITHNPTIQLIDSLVRARIVKTFLESNPSLENFSWLRMNKIGRMVRQHSRWDLQARLGKFYQLW